MSGYHIEGWGHVGCELVGVSVQKALVGYTIAVRFNLRGPSRSGGRDHRDLTNVGGELRLASGGVVARLELDRPSVRIHAPNGNPFELTAAIDHARLEAIEAHRSGSDIAWSAKVWGLVHPSDALETFDSSYCPLTISQSDWVKGLAAAQGTKMMLIEVPMPDPQGHPELAASARHLAAARERFGRGEYRGAVAHCREALEALGNVMGDPGKAPFVVKDGDLFANNRGKSKEERFQLLRLATRVVTHPAHHAGHAPESGVAVVEYDRTDAYAIMLYVAMLIVQAGKRS